MLQSLIWTSRIPRSIIFLKKILNFFLPHQCEAKFSCVVTNLAAQHMDYILRFGHPGPNLTIPRQNLVRDSLIQPTSKLASIQPTLNLASIGRHRMDPVAPRPRSVKPCQQWRDLVALLKNIYFKHSQIQLPSARSSHQGRWMARSNP